MPVQRALPGGPREFASAGHLGFAVFAGTQKTI